MSAQAQINQNTVGNTGKLAKLKSDIKDAQTQIEGARKIEENLRAELGKAEKDYQEAQDFIVSCRQKMQRLRNDFVTASDNRGAAQGRLSLLQGQISQLANT